jgi:hypothetical protein
MFWEGPQKYNDSPAHVPEGLLGHETIRRDKWFGGAVIGHYVSNRSPSV